MAEYRFLSAWCLEAPIDPVFEAIHDAQRWPEWWRGVLNVEELEPGDEDGIGQLDEHTWKSRLPYELKFRTRTTRIERPHLMEGDASGELTGSGRWRLYEADGTTAALYEWNVRTTQPW